MTRGMNPDDRHDEATYLVERLEAFVTALVRSLAPVGTTEDSLYMDAVTLRVERSALIEALAERLHWP